MMDDPDFRFCPGTTTRPMALSPEQLQAFNRDGFISPIRLLPADEIADFLGYFEVLLAQYLAAGQDQYSIASAHTRHGRVWDLVTDSRIVAVVRDILGNNVIGMGAHFWRKLPGDGKIVTWHQDAPYWRL